MTGHSSWGAAIPSVANSISFTKADLWPTNLGGASGCPSSFKTLSFTSPGGKGHALEDDIILTPTGQAKFWIGNLDTTFTSWDLKVDWDYPVSGSEKNYPHPVLLAMLLIGETDKVIYGSKLVYFTRDATGNN